ncbi:MAG: 3-deoxy-D-manno-octulosonic acid transferase [Bacteroidetes bacterium]|nr:3-deoxy-D-manno-octulosonic acid transferase [Bacteroidota bacterium]
MRFVYSTFIYGYGCFLRFAALFNSKARQWVDGRRKLFGRLETALREIDRKQNHIIWFHVSSLGEFEQGRPVIEAFRKRFPEKKILLTFFSPSGFEVRKNYDQADFVFYLPLDTPGNARKFIKIVQPEMVFFVKYDFWFNYMKTIHDQHIPLYFISALFRKNQHFFSWYGAWSRRRLCYVNHFFVQNVESESLLRSIGINEVTATGDTRFDRVFAIAAQSKPIPLIEKFCAGKQVFIAGSSWEPDEKVFVPLTRLRELNLKYIIAPHDTSPGRIREIRDRINQQSLCFSDLNDENANLADILIIDSVGILSQLYRYATIAFIGGGFAGGIHNIQEPVTFGVPVFFGPNYNKFREARDLVSLGGAFCVTSSGDLIKKVSEIIGNYQEYNRISAICRNYVEENRGATEKIVKYIEAGKLVSW